MYRGSLLKFGGDLFDKIIHQGLLVVVVSLLLAQSGCKLDTITVGSVDDEVFLKRKNQSLFLKVAGNIGSRKLLLIVHGGPGGNGLDYRDSIIKSNVESKIEQNQQFISGWIQVDGAHDYPLNDSLTEDMLSKRARIEIAAQRNLSHWQSVLEYCNSHNSSDGYEVSAQLNQYAHDGELLMDSVFVPETTYSADPSTSYSNNRFNGVVSGILGVDRPTYDIDPESYLKKINVPAFFIWGWFDFVCPPALCDDLQLKVGSSDKTIQYFYHSGHSPMMNEPELFWNSVLDWIDKH